jgi:hypothetical protein
MRRNNTRVMLLVVLFGPGAASLPADFTLDWFTLDAGGEMWTTGGDFELSGTIGQSDAGVSMTGGGFELAGGFWPGAAEEPACPGDLDGDGDVDLSDLALLLSDYGCTGGDCPGDIDGDGDTDLGDLATLLANYGEGTYYREQ